MLLGQHRGPAGCCRSHCSGRHDVWHFGSSDVRAWAVHLRHLLRCVSPSHSVLCCRSRHHFSLVSLAGCAVCLLCALTPGLLPGAHTRSPTNASGISCLCTVTLLYTTCHHQRQLRLWYKLHSVLRQVALSGCLVVPVVSTRRAFVQASLPGHSFVWVCIALQWHVVAHWHSYLMHPRPLPPLPLLAPTPLNSIVTHLLS